MEPGINESLVCMELIDELSGGNLMGSDPFRRAQTRLDAAQFDKEVVNMWYGYLMGNIIISLDIFSQPLYRQM